LVFLTECGILAELVPLVTCFACVGVDVCALLALENLTLRETSGRGKGIVWETCGGSGGAGQLADAAGLALGCFGVEAEALGAAAARGEVLAEGAAA
jgi:hypothetical protein